MDYMAAQMDRQIEGAQHSYDEALKEGEQPAFPVGATEYGGHGTCFGLTIRDYFAAKALQGMCADSSTAGTHAKDLCEECYKLADAMLAARAKP